MCRFILEKENFERLSLGKGQGKWEYSEFFSKKKTSRNIPGQKGMARGNILISFLKRNFEKMFTRKGPGKGEYSDFFSKKKTYKRYSLGKGRAMENIQFF